MKILKNGYEVNREQYIEEFHKAVALGVISSPTCTNYIPAEVIAKIVDYRLNWLFDNYNIVPKMCTKGSKKKDKKINLKPCKCKPKHRILGAFGYDYCRKCDAQH